MPRSPPGSLSGLPCSVVLAPSCSGLSFPRHQPAVRFGRCPEEAPADRDGRAVCCFRHNWEVPSELCGHKTWWHIHGSHDSAPARGLGVAAVVLAGKWFASLHGQRDAVRRPAATSRRTAQGSRLKPDPFHQSRDGGQEAPPAREVRVERMCDAYVGVYVEVDLVEARKGQRRQSGRRPSAMIIFRCSGGKLTL